MLEPTNDYTPAPTRYDSMRYNRCGASGLKLPAISLGFWHNFGDITPYEQMKQLVFTAFDNGITHFDLANNYGPEPGAAEKSAGRLIHQYFAKHRDELIVSTKAGYEMWTGPTATGAAASTCSPASTSRSSASAWTTWTSSTTTARTRRPRWRRRWARSRRPSPAARRCTWA